VRAFWARVRQGLTILRDRRRYFREVWLVQFGGWCFRFTRSGSCSTRSTSAARCSNVLLVLGVNAVAARVPFTPGGAGVQQALLVKVFAGTAAARPCAAYSVGQQIAIAAFSLALGFVALVHDLPLPLVQGRHRAGREARREGGRRQPRRYGAPAAPRARA
jgi:hypothetical protein